MAYAAVSGEPDLGPVLEAVLRMGKVLALPRCEPDGSITARRVSDLSRLIPGVFGIREPDESAEQLLPEQVDLILVPGMAFDRAGGRLGRGKGCYDRFLTGCSSRRIGICPADRLLAAVPMEPHDRYMDAVITDRETILCERR